MPRPTSFDRIRAGSRAFTLLEMVVVITIIAVLAGSLLPVLTRPYITEKRLETVNEMGAIETAIMGRPEYGDYGYIGTMGGLPPKCTAGAGYVNSAVTPLMYNCQNDPLVTVTPNSSVGGTPPVGVPTGWAGPYLRAQFQDPTLDAWGQAYQIVPNPTDPTQFYIQSYGPNQTQDAITHLVDDIVIPSQFNPAGATPATFYFSTAGALYVDLWANYGSWQSGLLPESGVNAVGVAGGDIQHVSIWYADVNNPGDLAKQQCEPVPLAGNTAGTQWACGDIKFGLTKVPFGLRTVEVDFNPLYCVAGQKFAAHANCNYVQNVVIERAATYERLEIAAAPIITPSIPTSPAGTPDIFAIGTTPPVGAAVAGTPEYLISASSAGDPNPQNDWYLSGGNKAPAVLQGSGQATLVDVIATGTVTQPPAFASGTTCTIGIVYNTSTTGGASWLGWGNISMHDTRNNLTTAQAGTFTWATPNMTAGQLTNYVRTDVPFSDELVVPLPANNLAAFDLVVTSNNQQCQVENAQMTIRQWITAP